MWVECMFSAVWSWTSQSCSECQEGFARVAERWAEGRATSQVQRAQSRHAEGSATASPFLLPCSNMQKL